MLTFSNFQEAVLEEALVTFGGRAYPKFNNIVIMSGGAGSGKGFIKDKLLGIEGMVFDVDYLKKLAQKSRILRRRILDETGIDISLESFSLKDPKNTELLHALIKRKDVELDDRWEKRAFKAIASAHPDRKPNLIFDVTGKSIKHFREVADVADSYGYDKSNIHVVWVLDDVKAAMEKNADRDRVVPEDILIETHEGAALTANKLTSMGSDIKRYMNGDYWIVFNKMHVDTTLAMSVIDPKDRPESMVVPTRLNKKETKRKGKGNWIDDGRLRGNQTEAREVQGPNFFRIKARGKAPFPPAKIGESILAKIREYAPKIANW